MSEISADISVKDVLVEYIVWVDSAGHDTGYGGWTPIEDVIKQIDEHGQFLCHTVGWIVHSTDDSITVSSTIAPVNESCCEPITIPRQSIVSHIPLNFKRP